ncbi:glycosyltransferase [Catalinimonas niigatensis]|uniref:glycosyltransferase n=1 Tax=Catalinimonas niigatensis TaxID=1397264 RepID=UPI002666A9C6|nr:glycosyltransferase [Catalinimonas niigatensis]WPP52614.1 glycosyltransferase [Catalinimonas niigatensis]
MKFTGKKILLISPEPWGQNFVSKHHYAVALAYQGNSVFFLNPPSSSYELQATQYENLYVVDYPRFLKGLRYLPEAIIKKIIRQKYEKLQQLTGCIFDIVWSFDNSVFYDFSALPEPVLKISHIVDLNQDFQTDKAARTVDICFCTTDFIMNKLLRFNANTFKIHHGTAFQNSYPKNNVSLPGNNKIKALYVGNLALKYIDWSLIELIIDKHPNVDFIFIGPKGKSNLSKSDLDWDNLTVESYPNVFFTGSVPHNEVSHYLQKSDVLLLAYKADAYLKQLANPHKLMEYFASGKIIVSTYTDEYKDKGHLLAMCSRNEDYPDLFEEVISKIDHYNNELLQKERIEFAYENTYEKQLKRIESHIKDVISQQKISGK